MKGAIVSAVLTALMAALPSHSLANMACNNNDVKKFYTSSVAHDGKTSATYERFDRTPGSFNAFNAVNCWQPPTGGAWTGCVQNFGKRYQFIATSGVTGKWSAVVCGRVRQANNHFNFDHRVFTTAGQVLYFGARVQFQWQEPNGNWRTLVGSDGKALDFNLQPNVNEMYGWKGIASPARRWRILITHAMRNDEFDIMMDW